MSARRSRSIDRDGVASGEFDGESFDGLVGALRAGANDRDGCEGGVLPVPVDPVRDLVQEIRLQSAVNCERGEDGVLDAPMLLAAE